MDQATFVDVASIDEKDVQLEGAPQTHIDYLRQVIVSRKQTPDVVTARSSLQDHAATRRQEAWDEVWAWKKQREFLANRRHIRALHHSCAGLEGVELPTQEDCDGWCMFCLEERNPSIPIVTKNMSHLSHHKGNPPTLTLLFSLESKQIESVLMHLLHFFLENGYSRTLYEWLYALLLFVNRDFEFTDKNFFEKVMTKAMDLCLEKVVVRPHQEKRNELLLIPSILELFSGITE